MSGPLLRAEAVRKVYRTGAEEVVALRDVDLVVIGYGGNDADDDRDEAQYEDDFRQVARLVRQARPEASCMLVAPLDQAERDSRGRIPAK